MENDSFVTASAIFYFGSDDYIAYKRYSNFGVVAFLSDIGGLLGLVLGVSVFSILEIFYFCTLRLYNNFSIK